LDSNKLSQIDDETFSYLKSLKNLSLSNNKIENISLNAFNSINNLISLNLTNNKIKNIRYSNGSNDVSIFAKLENLNDLQLKLNMIESINRNDFSCLVNLSVLNLNSNLIKSIEAYSFQSNKLLKELDLSYNRINSIDANTFNGFRYLNVLNLANNTILSINRHAFIDSFTKRIIISIKNITTEQVYNLKLGLMSIRIRDFYVYHYYDSIYIENRDDNDCVKTFFFMKYKILYNFLNDYDKDNFFLDCTQVTQLKTLA
jgi:Leucine-rich repeat (LRR) protein